MKRVDSVFADDVYQPGQHGLQGTVRLHHALWLSGGSGGVDHIGAVPRLRQADFGSVFPFGNDPADRLPVKGRLCLTVLQHEGDPVLGVFGIHRHIGRPGLMDADNRRRKFLHPAHAQGDKAVFPDPPADEPRSDGVGGPVQFRVGITAFTVDHGDVIRAFFHPFPEQVKPGLTDIVCQGFTL